MAGNYEINNEKFGIFLARLRKERGLTQKELAEKLYVSDKAVSKWERGLSLPDISLLQPLGEVLDVSVTELLSGQRIEPDQTLTVREVEPLVTGALTMTAQEREAQREHRRAWGKWFAAAILAFGLETWMLGKVVPLWDDFMVFWSLVPLLAGVFGAYFIFGAKEKLPAFYDQYPINFYSDNFVRMNFPGVHFNNRNWPYILNAIRAWSCVTLGVWALGYGMVRRVMMSLSWPEMAQFAVLMPLMMIGLFGGMFLPVYKAGKKYE